MTTAEDELLSKAISLRGDKKFEESKQILDALLSRESNHAGANYHMAWWHDMQGLEIEAIPFYQRALAGDLIDVDRQGALLGLGSTFRCVGQLERSIEVFERATRDYPGNASFEVFLALSQFEHGQINAAFARILTQLAQTTSNAQIAAYKRALLECADEISSRGITK